MQAVLTRAADAAERKLRILLVLEAAGGGAGRHVLDLARGLLARGHAVHLAWSPVRADEGFRSALPALRGLTAHAVPMWRNPGPRDAAGYRVLRALLAATRFDIIHGHSSKAGALARLASAGTAVAALYTPHAFITLDPELGLLRRIAYGTGERLLARLADAIICVSEEERAHALRLGIAARRLAVVPNGLAPLPRPDRSGARRDLGLHGDEVCVGFVGRLSHQKAVHRLVRAFALADPAVPARLALVGDGAERVRLEILTRKLGIAGRVIFTGDRAGTRLMAGFDVFALPSRYEAFPYVLLEAAARGLPIVTMDVGGASAVVREGENGYVVHAREERGVVEAMALRLSGLIGSSDARARLGRRSAARSRAFTAEAMVERTLGVYRQALARRAQ
jgi:glycosyltransferase involved in cell wall biosynthesis